jgi:MoaA/NifB/PqqE/SkfB family radical SAM enzyme
VTREEIDEFLAVPTTEVSLFRGIVGGEPLLSPNLTYLLGKMWEKGLIPKIFTSGTCALPEGIEALPPENPFFFIVNIAPWDTYTDREKQNLDRFLRLFHDRICLGFTLLNPDVPPDFLLAYREKYDLQNIIRLGMAMPILEGGNCHLPPTQYKDAAKWCLDLAGKAYQQSVKVGMDCGFVACMFTPAEVGRLLHWGADLSFACSPAVDVGPDLEAWHCFSLSKLPRISLRKNDSLTILKQTFTAQADELRRVHGPGIYARCRTCKFMRRHQCSGGCLAIVLQQAKTFNLA